MFAALQFKMKPDFKFNAVAVVTERTSAKCETKRGCLEFIE